MNVLGMERAGISTYIPIWVDAPLENISLVLHAPLAGDAELLISLDTRSAWVGVGSTLWITETVFTGLIWVDAFWCVYKITPEPVKCKTIQ